MDHISQIDSYSDTITAANRCNSWKPGSMAQIPVRLSVPGPLAFGPWDVGFGILEMVRSLNYLLITRGATMRSHWMIAALVSSALAAGCNGRNNDSSQNSDQNQAAAPANAPAATDQTVAPAPPAQTQPPYTTADNSAVRAERSTAASRATTGRREAPRAAAPSPQANS